MKSIKKVVGEVMTMEQLGLVKGGKLDVKKSKTATKTSCCLCCCAIDSAT
jgi:hypothetical protein